jgi:hypothetical protein
MSNNETQQDFGGALAALKAGQCVQRAGWNGKGQHVYLEEHLSFTIGAGVFQGQRRTYKPVFVLFNAQGEHQPGWVPSQGDLLAEDWKIAIVA